MRPVTNAFRQRVLFGRKSPHAGLLLPDCCHQCLSATSPLRTRMSNSRTSQTQPVTNAFRQRVLFGLNPKTDDENVKECHQCLSATSPLRTKSDCTVYRPYAGQSPMPFGNESSSDCLTARGWGISLRSHQCLSATSPLRTLRITTNHLAYYQVTNAFRQRVLFGLGSKCWANGRSIVTNAFRQRVLFGLMIKWAEYLKQHEVTNAFRQRVLFGLHPS